MEWTLWVHVFMYEVACSIDVWCITQNHHLGYDRWKVGSKMATSMMAPGQMPAPGVSPYDMHQQAAMLKVHAIPFL
jgi:hypothetical protein